MRSKSFNIKKIILLIVILFPFTINAARGCCSSHGGVAGCHSSGKQLCKDGTLSPSCTCTPTIKYVYGCTDSSAKNYNSKANKNDGSCKYYVYGCTDKEAKNYNPDAEKDDKSCEYYVYGCIDETAKNYNQNAEKDDGSCEYYVYGCMDKNAINYNESADKEDNSCEYNEIEKTSEDSSGISGLVTLGAIGTAVYFMKKKK